MSLFVGMVLISDGNLEHAAHAWKKNVFSDLKKNRLVTALDQSKCLKQIKKNCTYIRW